MEDFQKHLAKDPRLKKLLKIEITKPVVVKNITMKIVNSILGQQLSTTVAQVMRERLLALLKKKDPKAEDILKFTLEEIKAIGISRQKAQYILNVAEFMVAHKITHAKLAKMTDEEIIELISQIKGVGRWTVEMLLMFGLGREDVFAVDDLGIQKGMIKLFKLPEMKNKDLKIKMIKLSEKWSPFRTYACLYLWRSLD